MINIKRLHEVHNYYPNVPRRLGKTTYCFDSLLRALQTGYYKKLCYVTNTSQDLLSKFRDFKYYLYLNKIYFDEYDIYKLKVLGGSIIFTSQEDYEILNISDGIIEDLF